MPPLLNLQALTESYKNRRIVSGARPTMVSSQKSQLRENMMLALPIVYVPLALLPLVAFAQPTREIAEPTKVEIREPVRDAHTQQRRAQLRASLKAQSEMAMLPHTPAHTGRLLSDQERAVLRRQLRQQ